MISTSHPTAFATVTQEALAAEVENAKMWCLIRGDTPDDEQASASEPKKSPSRR